MELTQDDIKLLLSDCSDASLQLPDPSLLQYYKDVSTRTIWVAGEIDESTLDIMSKVIQWNREDSGLPIRDRKPIRLYFLSQGGQLDIAETIISIIKISKTPIYGMALGMVASAASLIYLSCHKRFALPNAYFIFHEGSCSNMSGSYAELAAAMEDYSKSVEKMTTFYIDNTTYSENEVRTKIKSDWYIYPAEALEHGIITSIIEDIDVFL